MAAAPYAVPEPRVFRILSGRSTLVGLVLGDGAADVRELRANGRGAFR